MITRLDARAPGRSVVELRDNRQKSIANGDLDAESAELPLSFGLKFFIFIRVQELAVRIQGTQHPAQRSVNKVFRSFSST